MSIFTGDTGSWPAYTGSDFSRIRGVGRVGGWGSDISGFSPRIDRIFTGEAVNPFFGAQDEGFSEFRSR